MGQGRFEGVEVAVSHLGGYLEADVEELADVGVVAGVALVVRVKALTYCSLVQLLTSAALGSCEWSMAMTVVSA